MESVYLTGKLERANLGYIKLAIADYDQAIRLDPQNANAYNNRGHAYEELGDKRLAQADFDRAKKLRSTEVNYPL